MVVFTTQLSPQKEFKFNSRLFEKKKMSIAREKSKTVKINDQINMKILFNTK